DIDRADVVEFNRRWNLSNTANPTAEDMIESMATYSPLSGWNFRAGFGKLRRGVASDRWEVGVEFKRPRLPELHYDLENISRQDTTAVSPQNSGAQSKWLRQRGTVTYSFWKLHPLLSYEGEDRRDTLPDSAAGFRFNSYTGGMNAQLFPNMKVGAVLNYRQDDFRSNFGLAPKSTSTTQSYSWSLDRWRALSADFSFTHRERDFADSTQDTRADLADFRLRFSPYKRAIDSDWQYQITTTQVAVQQRVFFRVPPGEGNYIFNPALNEYVPQRFGDYILRVIPTEDFVPVVELRTRLNLRVKFGDLFRGASPKSWKRYLLPVSTETFIRIEEKTRDPDIGEIYKLNLAHFLSPEYTIFGGQSLRQDIYLWENRRERSLRYRVIVLRELSNQFIDEGLLQRDQWRHELRLTLSLTPKLSSQTEIIFNRDDKIFQESTRQDRLVRNRGGVVDLSYRPRSAWEIAAAVGASFDEDRAYTEPTKARAVLFKPRTTYSLRGMSRLSAEVEWINVTVTPSNRALPYELANGNRPGTTYRWNLTFEYRVSNFVNFFASYLGHKEPDRAKIFHLAKMEIRAFF
ncbi:MAG: hypothetical protein ONA90_08275, partial [candidate division KSB1 bacterium]|nr:hypothetical protein [candidate division KSB1 bacterium]